MHTYHVTFVPSDCEAQIVLVVKADSHAGAVQAARETICSLGVFMAGAEFSSEYIEQ